MSVTYEPLPIKPPDFEQMIAAHLRSLNTRDATWYGRTFPTLPVTIAGTTYTAAVVVRDDGGTWPNRSISVTVLGARDASYSGTHALAADITSRLSMLTDFNLPVASVEAVRGPVSVADDPPEFQTTVSLLAVG